MTEGGDIGFRVYHQADDTSQVIELVPVSRIESHLVMEEGEVVCDCVGKCNFYCIVIESLANQSITWFFFSDWVEFENGFSFFRSKKVYYQITIQVPIKF